LFVTDCVPTGLAQGCGRVDYCELGARLNIDADRERLDLVSGHAAKRSQGAAYVIPTGTPTPAADCAVSHARLPIFVSPGVDDAVSQYSS
jgi:hypothetical protein